MIMESKNLSDDAVIMEFKVHDEEDENPLTDTVQRALRQIKEKGSANRQIKKFLLYLPAFFSC